MTEDIRITTYCESQEQKEKVQFLIRNVKQKHRFKKTGDALEFICDKYVIYGIEIQNVIERADENRLPEGGIIFK